MGRVIEFKPRASTDEYFGGCPECGKNDGYRNIGRLHVFFCDEHKMCWPGGENLFSDWREFEDEEDWKRNAEELSAYRDVEPIYPETESQAANALADNEDWPF